METLQRTSELQRIEQGLEAFESRKAELMELAESATGMRVENTEDREGYSQVSAKRKELKAARVLVEKEGKAMRDLITPITKHISAKEKELVAIVGPVEDRLAEMEKWYELQQEEIKRAKLEADRKRVQDRIDQLAAYGVAIDFAACIGMSDEHFELKLQQAKSEFESEQIRKAEEEARIEAEKKAEAERMERERAELEAQRKEQEAEHQRQADALAAIEAEHRKLAEEKAAIEAEKARIEKEKREAIEAEERAIQLENARKEAAATALKNAEEKAKREAEAKAEADRIAAEKEARRIARMPDKKKLLDFANNITGIVSPELKSPEADAILSEAVKQLARVQSFIMQQCEGL